MTRIVGIAGSLRRGSFNQSLLRAAIAVSPPHTVITPATIAGIPLYDGDEEAAHGIPAAAAALKEEIVAADGLLIVTPEYNNSIPGVLKNAIDWLSRPGADIPRVFGDKPVAIMGATPGQGGTRLSQAAWLPVLRTLGTRPWFGQQLYVTQAGQAFDAQGELIDEKLRQRLAGFVKAFAEFVSRPR